jgi:hypothetical protein
VREIAAQLAQIGTDELFRGDERILDHQLEKARRLGRVAKRGHPLFVQQVLQAVRFLARVPGVERFPDHPGQQPRDLLGVEQPENRVVVGEDARVDGVLRELHHLLAVLREEIVGAAALGGGAAAEVQLFTEPAMQFLLELGDGRRVREREAVAFRDQLVDEKNLRRDRKTLRRRGADGIGEEVPDVDVTAERERLLPRAEELDQIVVHPFQRRLRVSCRTRQHF